MDRKHIKIKRILLASAFLMLFSPWAGAVVVTKSFTGHWKQPEQDSHGITVQVIKTDSGKGAVIYWLTFDDAGEPIWYGGIGEVDREQIVTEMVRVSGPVFMQDASDVPPETEPFGTLVLSFQTCNQGTGDFIPDGETDVAYSFPIARLTSIFGHKCSGGISDDTPDGQSPWQKDIALGNTGLAPDASASIDFAVLPARVFLWVETNDLPAGTYDFMVDGVDRGDIEVADQGNSGKTRGRLRFASPATGQMQLLDFEVVGLPIEIVQGTDVYFTGQIDAPEDP